MNDSRPPVGAGQEVVIVGAGHGGVEAAASLRLAGFAGSITLLERDLSAPYERPPLSKTYLSGERGRDELGLRAPGYLSERGVELKLGVEVTGVDRIAQSVRSHDGVSHHYDWLVLATGGRPRRLSLPGADAGGVIGLARIEDSDRLRSLLHPGGQLVVVGGGFIGMEVAATARNQGMEVTLVEVMDRLMMRVLSAPMSATFQKRHERAGVRVLTGRSVDGLEQIDDHVTGVHLSDGSLLKAEVVLVGVGSEAASSLAVESGLPVERGVVVDEFCRTDDPHVFAIGDVAEAWNPYSEAQMRLECVQNAVSQARTVASVIVGTPRTVQEVPWFWTDQHDLHLKIAGTSLGADETFVRGDVDSDAYSVGHLRRGRLISLEALNRPKDFMQAKKLIADGAHIDRTRAIDDSLPLSSAASESQQEELT